jgi:hypothetical protein
MTYYESAEGVTISRKRALRELRNHGISPDGEAEFFAEMGDRDDYDAQSVLQWLGY